MQDLKHRFILPTYTDYVYGLVFLFLIASLNAGMRDGSNTVYTATFQHFIITFYFTSKTQSCQTDISTSHYIIIPF